MCMYTYIFESLFSVLLGIFLGVALLGLREILFNFLRKWQIVFYSYSTILYSHQQCMRAPVSPHPRLHLLLSLFVIIVILMDVK